MTGSAAPARSYLRIPAAALLAAAVLIAATAGWLFHWRSPLGIAHEWQIKPLGEPWPWQGWMIPVSAIVVPGLFAAVSAYDRFRRAKTRSIQTQSTVLAIIGLTLMSFAWQWTTLGPIGAETLVYSTWSDVANGYFGTAYQVGDAREFSRNYSEQWQNPNSPLQAHVATHPPGAVLFYLGARRIFEASQLAQNLSEKLTANLTRKTDDELADKAADFRIRAARSANVSAPPFALPVSAVPASLWVAFIISLVLALAVPAVYFMASRVGLAAEGEDQAAIAAGAEARGLIAAALFGLAPSAGLFAFTLDAVVACGAAWTLAFVAFRLAGGKPGWMILAGITLAVTTFVSLGALAVGVIAVLAALIYHGTRNPNLAGLKRAGLDAALLGAGFAGGWLLLMAAFPMNPAVVFSKAMSAHHIATLATRHHLPWTVMNLVMFAIFCGWPIIGLTLGGAWTGLRSRLNNNPTAISAGIGLATVATLLLLTLSGNVRGEVERLWLFLIPALCVSAATLMPVLPPRAENAAEAKSNRILLGIWVGLLLAQAFQTVMMAASLSPLVRPG